MDRERFDALTRRLASSGPRRTAIGALIGVSLFGGLTDGLARPGKGNGKTRRKERQQDRRRQRQRRRRQDDLGGQNPGPGSQTCAGQSACVTPNAPHAYCTADGICYCAVTRAGEPVCVTGAIQVSGGCQTDQDCVDAVAGSYCIGASNQLQSPCIFGQSFCASPCRSA